MTQNAFRLQHLLEVYNYGETRSLDEMGAKAIEALLFHELIEVEDGKDQFSITEKGEVLVQAMLALPLPVQTYIMPTMPKDPSKCSTSLK